MALPHICYWVRIWNKRFIKYKLVARPQRDSYRITRHFFRILFPEQSKRQLYYLFLSHSRLILKILACEIYLSLMPRWLWCCLFFLLSEFFYLTLSKNLDVNQSLKQTTRESVIQFSKIILNLFINDHKPQNNPTLHKPLTSFHLISWFLFYL